MPKLRIRDTNFEKMNEFLDGKKLDGVAKDTLRAYKSHLTAILPMDEAFDETDWDSVIRKVQSREDISAYSKRSYLISLRTFMKWNGLEFKHKIKKVETIKETYTDEELRLMIAKPKRPSFAEYRTWVIILLVLDTGIRAASIRNIKCCDVINNTIVLRHTKNKKAQMVVFSEQTRNAIASYMRYREGSEEDYLFCDIYGKQLSENGLKHSVEKYNAKRGVTKKSIHLLRHTFAKKQLLDCGTSPLILMKMLGHQSLEMTNHYCDLWNEDVINSYKSPVEALRREHKFKIK